MRVKWNFEIYTIHYTQISEAWAKSLKAYACIRTTISSNSSSQTCNFEQNCSRIRISELHSWSRDSKAQDTKRETTDLLRSSRRESLFSSFIVSASLSADVPFFFSFLINWYPFCRWTATGRALYRRGKSRN